MEPITCSMVILTTGHLSSDTRRQMDAWCKTIDVKNRSKVSAAPTLMGATDWGWMVYCPETRCGMPDDLWACLKWATKRGHTHVLFDAEGGEFVDGLPVYDRGE